MWNQFPAELVTKVEPNINSVEVHPQLGNHRHPMDGELVDGGSLWQTVRSHLHFQKNPDLTKDYLMNNERRKSSSPRHHRHLRKEISYGGRAPQVSDERRRFQADRYSCVLESRGQGGGGSARGR
jgi:hypothetical protein